MEVSIKTSLQLTLGAEPPRRLVQDIAYHFSSNSISHAVIEMLILGELPATRDAVLKEASRRIMGSFLLEQQPLRVLFVNKSVVLMH